MLGLLAFYREVAWSAVLSITIISGGLVWLFGRTAVAHRREQSDLWAGRIPDCSGFVRKDFKSIVIAAAVFIAYGGLVLGHPYPVKAWISWEGHLFGALAGLVSAFIFNQRVAAL